MRLSLTLVGTAPLRKPLSAPGGVNRLSRARPGHDVGERGTRGPKRTGSPPFDFLLCFLEF